MDEEAKVTDSRLKFQERVPESYHGTNPPRERPFPS